MSAVPDATSPGRRDGFAAILGVFLRLGLTSFGGPVAHIGYLREEFVSRRGWITDRAYADLVALAQFLPGPASSQTGFAIGVLRRGLAGGLAAWLGFTLPSAIVMLLAAHGVDLASGGVGAGVVHGLKLVAVAVVAQAVWSMAGSLCPDRTRGTIAVAATLALLVVPSAWTQIGVIVAGGCVGLLVLRDGATHREGTLRPAVPGRTGVASLVLAGVLLVSLPLFASEGPHALALFEAAYRAGALVFGGGHVVLPLLETSFVPRWMSADTFLAGYGVAQAVPGPLFSFGAFLGAAATPSPNGVLGGAIALVAIFLPGLLLIYGMLPFWDRVRGEPTAQAMLRGVNAAVVGILLAALYDPIFLSSVKTPEDFAIEVACFAALVLWRVPAWAAVATTAAAGAAAQML